MEKYYEEMVKIQEENADRGYNNQRNGIAFERKQWNIEKRNSMLSIISSGSRSPIDVVAIRKNYILLITCKENGYLNPSERKEIQKLKEKLPSFCKIQLRYKEKRKMRKVWLWRWESVYSRFLFGEAHSQLNYELPHLK